MTYPVYVKSFTPPKINVKEVLRYLRVDQDVPEIDQVIKECLDELADKLTYNVCYAEIPIKICGDDVDLGFTITQSKNLSFNLKNCDKAVLFVATVGIAIDRLIAKYGAISPTKAVIFQAIGTERIEAFCDLFNEEIALKYGKVAPRFSPGYGDLPIELQKEIFDFLQCQKRIGVALNGSLLMSPTKSVSAFIGIEKTC